MRWYCNLAECSLVWISDVFFALFFFFFFAFWKGTRGLGRPCRSKTNPAPQAGKPETSLSIWGKGAGALSFFQVLLFTVVILPRRDCDFYRKSLQTGPRWWEVEVREHTHTHTQKTHSFTDTQTHTHKSIGLVYRHSCTLIKYKPHTQTHTHTQTKGENWLVAPGWSLCKDKARQE